MMKINKCLVVVLVAILVPEVGVAVNDRVESKVSGDIAFASNQYGKMLDFLHNSNQLLIPKSMDKMSLPVYIPVSDWCSGFFPGSLWYLYRLTGKQKWRDEAEKYTETLDTVQYLTWHHDIGFIIGCSYLNGYRLTHDSRYKKVIIQAARSLSTRFRKGAGVIQSWNTNNGWQATRGWKCPVIIDNIMNLELLFEATRLSGDSTFYDIAVSHADMTLKHHFRPDGSCYHVVDYDSETGEVLHRQNAQGYADESAWARGQAWAIYGYTMCYRYTHKKEYLNQAVRTLHFILNHKNMPADMVPYWDYDAPNIPNEPKDVSSAACVASALYELNTYLPGRGYRQLADRILTSLSSTAYRAPIGKNGFFLLMHSVGSIPHNSEIDVPLNYADYYFLESLCRHEKMKGLYE